MTLAGRLAQASHELTHTRVPRAVDVPAMQSLWNGHNLTWRNGNTIVHREGATPAEAGRLGIVPGLMASEALLVEGLESALRLKHQSRCRRSVGPQTGGKDLVA